MCGASSYQKGSCFVFFHASCIRWGQWRTNAERACRFKSLHSEKSDPKCDFLNAAFGKQIREARNADRSQWGFLGTFFLLLAK